MASMRSRYSAVRYRLRIDLSTGSEPLWSGMWKWGWNLLLSATWAMISGVKRLGSMLLMRNRSAGTSLSRAWTKSKNDSPVDLPKSPMFTPVSTISLAP